MSDDVSSTTPSGKNGVQVVGGSNPLTTTILSVGKETCCMAVLGTTFKIKPHLVRKLIIS